MAKKTDITGYIYSNAELNQSHNKLLPAVLRIIRDQQLCDIQSREENQIFELGCGNGAVANVLSNHNFKVTGVDPSEQGIIWANSRYPHLKLFQASAYDDLACRYGQFPVVLSLEVVEHVISPKEYASTLYELVSPGGTAIISTPYHGYWKNLALAITGKMDEHFTVLWDGGHIKFWSFKTLRLLLEEAGFKDIVFQRVGRIPVLATSMIAIAKK